MVDIKASVYKVFYDVLCETIIRKQYIEKDLPVPGISKLWNTFGKKIVYPFSGYRATSKDYFKKIMFELNPETAISGQISHEALYRGLVYIEFNPNIPIDNISRKRIPVADAEHLLLEFQNKFHGEIQKNELKQIAIIQGNLGALQLTQEQAVQANSILEKVEYDLKSATNIINGYIENITRKNYSEAWKSWTNYSRTHSWVNDFERFKQLHEIISSVDDYFVFNVKKYRQSHIRASLTMEYKLQSLSMDELKNIFGLQVLSLDKFCAELRNMQKKFAARGIKNFETLGLHDLLEEPIALNHIIKTLRLTAADLEALFEESSVIQRKRVFDCSLHFEDDMWQISYISGYGRDDSYIV